MMDHSSYSVDDFDLNPLMFYYEVTQACDLVCAHCRASAQEQADPRQLTQEQSRALIDQVCTFPRRPTMVMTGGDPLKRSDIFELIEYGTSQGLQIALTPSATPLATAAAFGKARDAGVRRLGISLDGADAATHDAFRGWEGSFDRTLQMLEDARQLGLAVQINTTVTKRNLHQIDALAELLATRGIAMWALFFLVPVGRGLQEERLEPEQYEEVFEKIWHHAQRQPYGIKTTEAPHYRRFVLERGGDPLAGPATRHDSSRPVTTRHDISGNGTSDEEGSRGHRAPLGVGDGKGIMFVGHTGEIFPAGFLPIECGRFPEDSVVEVYQRHPLFQSLRDPDLFQPKCGTCDYRHTCGGSRARAYAVTGDPLAAEPDCVFEGPCGTTTRLGRPSG